MSLVDLYLAGLKAGGAPGSTRPNPAVVDEMNRRSDDMTEAALLPRERAGTLTPGQRETLAEIRANRVGAAPAITITPPAAAVAPMAKVNTPPIAAPSTTVSPPVLAGTPDGWRAEFERSPELQAEFGSVDRWVNYQQGVADGRIGPARGGRVVRSGSVSMLSRNNNSAV